MKTSESINEIASALSKAQAVMTGAKKGSNNPFFKSKYSDLSQVMEAISVPFAENDLSFIQSPSFADGMVTVTTRIMHGSGQWIEGTVSLPPVKNDAQGYGSAITYGKRYGIQAMAGVPSVDDDGNASVKSSLGKGYKPSKTPKANPLRVRFDNAKKNALLNMDESVFMDKVAEVKSNESDPKKQLEIIETFAGVK